MYIDLYVPVILVRLYWNMHFIERFFKNPEVSNFMIFHPVGAELFPIAGET